MRYVYTDPLAAAWMAKHFNCKLKDQNGNEIKLCKGTLIHTNAIAFESEVDDGWEEYQGRFYIHPDSLHLLQPSISDFCSCRDEFLIEMRGFYAGDMGIYIGYGGSMAGISGHDGKLFLKGRYCHYKANTLVVIQRDGIPFMWPECED